MARLTRKGQVTVPQHIREYVRRGPEPNVNFPHDSDGPVVLTADAAAT
jgi:bifunctional DNA-binding transcriptional regulator/antitoxin component of YhaV-PrlF toxin-antitoxin module